MINSGRKPQNGTAVEHVPHETGVHVQDSKQESCLFRMDLQVRPNERLPGDVVGEGGQGKGKEPIVIAGNVTSENCRVEMRVNATAMRFDVYYAKAMNYTLMVTAASFIQVRMPRILYPISQTNVCGSGRFVCTGLDVRCPPTLNNGRCIRPCLRTLTLTPEIAPFLADCPHIFTQPNPKP